MNELMNAKIDDVMNELINVKVDDVMNKWIDECKWWWRNKWRN